MQAGASWVGQKSALRNKDSRVLQQSNQGDNVVNCDSTIDQHHTAAGNKTNRDKHKNLRCCAIVRATSTIWRPC